MARNRRQLHQFLLRAFIASGMSRAELAKRTGKSPEVISRILGRPSNLTADTVMQVLFAINGMSPDYRSYDPLEEGVSTNMGSRPAWADPVIERIVEPPLRVLGAQPPKVRGNTATTAFSGSVVLEDA